MHDAHTGPPRRERKRRSPGRWALPLREFLANYGSHTSLLVPPYHALQPLPRLERAYQPPLGTIVVVHGRDLYLVLAELRMLRQQWPWVVPCVALLLDQWRVQRVLEDDPDASTRLAIGRIRNASDVLRTALAAVHRRPLPTPDDLAWWVSERIEVPAYYLLLRAQFTSALEGEPPSRTFSRATASRRFPSLGSYTARDWRALARLSVALCAVTSGADRLPWPPQAKDVRKYLKMPVTDATLLLGWEWVLERALRLSGYVKGVPGPS